jgi:hypothetical protein
MTRKERFAQFEEYLTSGPLSTAQIAAQAGMTARGAREILIDMQAAGRVQVSDHPPSSPLRVWSLSPEVR